MHGAHLFERPRRVTVMVFGSATRVAAVYVCHMSAAVFHLHDVAIARVGCVAGEHHEGAAVNVHAALDNASDGVNQLTAQ